MYLDEEQPSARSSERSKDETEEAEEVTPEKKKNKPTFKRVRCTYTSTERKNKKREKRRKKTFRQMIDSRHRHHTHIYVEIYLYAPVYDEVYLHIRRKIYTVRYRYRRVENGAYSQPYIDVHRVMVYTWITTAKKRMDSYRV